MESLGDLQVMGILNSLKTGNMQTDLLIAMCMPFALKILFSNAERVAESIFSYRAWKMYFTKMRGYHERTISSKSMISMSGWNSGDEKTLDSDTKNSVLMKAIRLYMNAECKIEMKEAVLDLTGTETAEEKSIWDDDDADSKTAAGTLSQYKLVKRPVQNHWHDIGTYGTPARSVEIFISEYEDNEGGDEKERRNATQMKTTTYFLRSLGSTAIDDFVNKAYAWYLNELRKLEDDSRHLFELQKREEKKGEDEEDSGPTIQYKKYKLSDEKGFDSLFFREKSMILKLVENFSEKKGKYAVKGYPHKLGILLHGPPGTGKTSLIKALAQHTGRSLVNVPLAKIRTNSELMSIFFDQKYDVIGDDVPVSLGFKDVIFVLEDVDAASSVVKRRDGKTTSEVHETEVVDCPPPQSIWSLLLKSNDSDCKELVKTLLEKSERLKKEVTCADALAPLCEGLESLPGLPLVGSSDPVVASIGEETVEAVDKLIEGQSKVDSFLNAHIGPLKNLLDSDMKVDDKLVDALLEVPTLETTSLIGGTDKPGSAPRQSMLVSDEKGEPPMGGAELLQQFFAPVDNSQKGKSSWVKPGSDKLNLTGLLNVLDGVVDSPGRMVIMTTNHPEILDPALIRPGRIDKKLLLGYMKAPDVADMIEHYFQTTLHMMQRVRLEEAINGNVGAGQAQLNLTPAQIEQLTAEHDEVDKMIEALEEKGQPSKVMKEDTSPEGGGSVGKFSRRMTSIAAIAFDV